MTNSSGWAPSRWFAGAAVLSQNPLPRWARARSRRRPTVWQNRLLLQPRRWESIRSPSLIELDPSRRRTNAMNTYVNKYLKANGANQPAIVLAGVIAALAAVCVWRGQDTG